jgi:hypothetical protein
MEAIEFVKERNRLKTISNYLRSINKKMPGLHRMAKGVGKIHQWRAAELQEMLDKFTKEVDKQVSEMERTLTAIKRY